MSLFFRRGEEKIFHVNSLPEEMRAVLRSVMDGTLSDVAAGYGLSYLSPRVGEPIFIHFGRLNGNFKNAERAYHLLLQRIDEAAQSGLNVYAQWYPDDLLLRHYWITYYSFVDPEEGILPGIAAHPLAATAGDRFGLKDLYTELQPLIKGKRVLLALPTLTGQVYNRKSKFWAMEPSSVQVHDPIWERMDEVVQAFADEYEVFHGKVDNDKLFDSESSVRHMTTMLNTVNQVRSMVRVTDSMTDQADVILVPYFVIPHPFRVGSGVKVKQAWESAEGFTRLRNDGRFYELNSMYVLLNYEFINSLLQRIASIYPGVKIVLLTDKKAPPVDKCASGECPKILSEVRFEKDGDRLKIFST
jgi:hypothetical protein